jgi:predicted ArsR family transcriptional regulator
MTTTRKSRSTKALANTSVAAEAPAKARSTKKTDRLLGMLQAPGGASIEELSEELGWLQHTTRAALTGLRKKGIAITRDKQGSVTVYRASK